MSLSAFVSLISEPHLESPGRILASGKNCCAYSAEGIARHESHADANMTLCEFAGKSAIVAR